MIDTRVQSYNTKARYSYKSTHGGGVFADKCVLSRGLLYHLSLGPNVCNADALFSYVCMI